MKLIFFYDSSCQLCNFEVSHLQRLDSQGKIRFEDLYTPEGLEHYPDVNPQQAMEVLHGIYQGKLIKGLEVSLLAWQLVGKGKWVNWLNWPGIRILSRIGYRLFAKHRQFLSPIVARLLGIKNCHCNPSDQG
ncbi:thiol-disulfide oxidoreductase DCC family protein [Paraferrimonas sp. SM1919]|uniref:thiol-disulfide oxidoreductase DCC family protein n=1 Tax=Paraferrimonas sp. SM1919 TaxID=2662263 RepID=UPI0013D0A37E|nr:DUF393 domain-containing protein [Paraferrimonas sp. SM1919]